MPTLHDFQVESVKKFTPPPEDERSVLIGDDMGLGKTVQAIALDYQRRRMHNCDYTAQTLVVTKMSVMGGWMQHYEDWAPHLKAYVIDPKKRTAFAAALRARNSKTGFPEYQVFICHWQVLRFIQEELASVAWFHIIGDEIQAIKNRKAQVTRAFKKMKPYYKTGLSGTWADNHPDDAWSILNWLWPDLFRAFNTFSAHHTLKKTHNTGTCLADGCDKYHRTAYQEIVGTANAEELHGRIAHGYIRRTKPEVLKSLPDKYYSTVRVDLHPQQLRAYQQMEGDMLAWVGKHENEPIAAPVVIAKLVRLQQFACAYGRLDTIVKNGEKLLQLRLDEPSSKLDAVMDIIGDTNEPLVVFSQSKQVVNLLAARLQRAKIPVGILTGDTKASDRPGLISEFQRGGLRVFASTIQAGGVGITLTRASTCVFIDRAWSPSANKQAEDRLHRLGQKNAVHIIDLVARRTIDAARNYKIELKWEWLREILGDKGYEVKKHLPQPPLGGIR